MGTIESKKHEPIVYDVHDLITEHPGRTYPVRDLCLMFYGKYTKSLDTKMRNIVAEIVNDRALQKIIISTKEGYLSPTLEQSELVQESVDEIEKTARALFYRRSSIKYRIDHDQQFKLKIGINDSPIYEAYEREANAKTEKELETKNVAKKEKRKSAPVIYKQTETGQISFGV
jgi:DNA-binding transcriptional regulator/RsmH inhibitor MraZ